MTEEERRYEILEVRKKGCEELIQKNKNMSITGCVTTAAGLAMAVMYGSICNNCYFHNEDLAQILFYGTGSLIFGSASLAQGYKMFRNALGIEKLKAELKEIQSELKQLKENNMDDTMGMGR